MQLLIKQRVFSWTDTYDVYDEHENPKYFVKAEFSRKEFPTLKADKKVIEVALVIWFGCCTE